MVAQFGWNPRIPSVFDTVDFFSQVYDPVGLGAQSETWDFGDGATATGGCCVAGHRYAADGTYHVTLTIVTPDGRTDEATQDLVVKTHDVAITDVSVPDSIRVGSTKTVTVGISNSRYPEPVRVSFFKSVGGSGGNNWRLVGELTQYVPVKKGRRTVDFSFNYTATADDAVLGKITFMASAATLDGPDAIPADNSYTSLPVKSEALTSERPAAPAWRGDAEDAFRGRLRGSIGSDAPARANDTRSLLAVGAACSARD